MASLKLEEIKRIEYCLRESILPVKDSGLDFEINRNLYRLGRKIDHARAELKLLNEKFYFRDDQGKVKKYILEMKNETFGIFKLNEQGDRILADQNYKGASAPVVDDKNEEYKTAKEKFDNEPIEVDLIEFPLDQVEKAFREGKFSGLDLTPLFGHIIKTE